MLIIHNCKVINVSMGCTEPSDKELTQYKDDFGAFLKKFLDCGYDFVIVQAAGNECTDAKYSGLYVSIDEPEVEERIIVVGAIGLNNASEFYNSIYDSYIGELLNLNKLFWGYECYKNCNYGELIDICAPGVNIYSTVLGSEYTNRCISEFGDLKAWEGTSMAAPHVSGVVAMCYSVNPTLTGAQVKHSGDMSRTI